jgi:CHAD domain-containing protein
MARAQLRNVLDRVLNYDRKGRDEAVHDARKRFKKLRALLKLVRPGLGEKTYQRENATFRDSARPLSEVRDARALVEALDKLAQRFGDVAPPDAVAAARQALERRRDEVRRRVLDEQGALGAVGAAVKAARARVKDWSPDGWAALRKGLRRSYGRGHQARSAAHADPSDENLHEWRKRVKDLWHQLEILRPARPDFLEPLAEQAHQLADLLGDDHDLVVLSDVLPQAVAGGEAENLLPLSGRRRQELREEAFRLGEHVYRESPAAFARRLSAYWKAWRAEAKAAQFA